MIQTNVKEIFHQKLNLFLFIVLRLKNEIHWFDFFKNYEYELLPMLFELDLRSEGHNDIKIKEKLMLTMSW